MTVLRDGWPREHLHLLLHGWSVGIGTVGLLMMHHGLGFVVPDSRSFATFCQFIDLTASG